MSVRRHNNRMFSVFMGIGCMLLCVLQATIFAGKATWTIDTIDGTNKKISVTIPIQPDEHIYAKDIRFSVSNPSITLSAYESSVTPSVHYDATYKEDRTCITTSPTLTCTATAASTKDTTQGDIHLVYYTNKQKEPFEEVFPITFNAPVASTNNATIVQKAQEQAPAPNQEQAAYKEAKQPTQKESVQHKLSFMESLKKKVKETDQRWLQAILAFLLGLLLSLTPCIYPMIPITIGILQANKASSLLRNFLLALAYTMGIATTFAIFGLLASFAGQRFGKFMYHPIVIGLIVLVLIYSALSLFGFYEIRLPKFLQRQADSTHDGSIGAAYLFGVISGTVASPCLSPGLLFMLMLVSTMSYMAGFLLLFSFAVGLSIPLLIIGTFSNSFSMLPRAGSWMVEIKYFLGCVLLGMCLYFLSMILPLWVLYIVGAAWLLGTGTFYLYHARNASSKPWNIFANILGMACMAGSAFVLFKAVQERFVPSTQAALTGSISWETNYQNALIQARTKGKKLFVKFHAPGCADCKKLGSYLNTPKALAALAPFIVASCDLSDAKNEYLAKQFNIQGAPACVLIDAANEEVIQDWLAIEPEGFDALIEYLSTQH